MNSSSNVSIDNFLIYSEVLSKSNAEFSINHFCTPLTENIAMRMLLLWAIISCEINRMYAKISCSFVRTVIVITRKRSCSSQKLSRVTIKKYSTKWETTQKQFSRSRAIWELLTIEKSTTVSVLTTKPVIGTVIQKRRWASQNWQDDRNYDLTLIKAILQENPQEHICVKNNKCPRLNWNFHWQCTEKKTSFQAGNNSGVLQRNQNCPGNDIRKRHLVLRKLFTVETQNVSG